MYIGDRMIESVLWIVLADLGLVPVWIPIVVISRDIFTDSIRGYVLRFGYTAFGKATMMRTSAGKFITGSPWMRTSYAILKAITFSWLLFVSVLDELLVNVNSLPPAWVGTGLTVGYWFAIVTAIMCLVRGAPVIVEGIILIQRMEGKAETSDSD